MPTNEEMTTVQILDALDEQSLSQPAYALLQELKYRIIPENDEAGATEYRGGIRPTHAPSH